MGTPPGHGPVLFSAGSIPRVETGTWHAVLRKHLPTDWLFDLLIIINMTFLSKVAHENESLFCASIRV